MSIYTLEPIYYSHGGVIIVILAYQLHAHYQLRSLSIPERDPGGFRCALEIPDFQAPNWQ